MAAEIVIHQPAPTSGEEAAPREAQDPSQPAGPALDVGLAPNGLSFQNRIAVVALITALAVLLAACFMFMLAEWRTERSHFVQNQTMLAEVVASHAARAVSPLDTRRLGLGLSALSADPRIISAYVADAQGRPLSVYRRPGASQAAGPDDVQVSVPFGDGRGSGGRLVMRARGEGFGSLLPRFVSLGGALFFVAAGLALFMGRWLAGSLAKPVDRLSRAMGEVARSGDFAQRVERVAEDEFGRLTDSFNDLLAQLNRNDQELRKAMTALVEARDAAEAANVLKSHFLANISHEIRTPLNGVLAMAQIMAMGELTPGQRERLAVIQQSGEALLAVLNDVLDLSKIEAGRMELEDGEFDTAVLIGEVEAVHAALAAKKGLDFKMDMRPGAEGRRSGDIARIRQILNNLVSNAVKFTLKGEVRVTIEGVGPAGGEGLKIAVTDTGIGVPADKLPLLFQKFTQVDSSTTRQFGGTGLGLAICRELAQLMGGSVWAKSRQGSGSTFFFSVPAPRLSAPKPAPAPEEPSALTGPAGRGLRVLAAEDNSTNQLVLKTVMATFGLDVDMVADGRQALDAWNARPYDLILMDIQMPVMDGLAATRAIRDAEARIGRRRTPIIALSANAMTHQVKEYLAAGMDSHVPKPIQLARLQQALEEALAAPGEPRLSEAAG